MQPFSTLSFCFPRFNHLSSFGHRCPQEKKRPTIDKRGCRSPSISQFSPPRMEERKGVETLNSLVPCDFYTALSYIYLFQALLGYHFKDTGRLHFSKYESLCSSCELLVAFGEFVARGPVSVCLVSTHLHLLACRSLSQPSTFHHVAWADCQASLLPACTCMVISSRRS